MRFDRGGLTGIAFVLSTALSGCGQGSFSKGFGPFEYVGFGSVGEPLGTLILTPRTLELRVNETRTLRVALDGRISYFTKWEWDGSESYKGPDYQPVFSLKALPCSEVVEGRRECSVEVRANRAGGGWIRFSASLGGFDILVEGASVVVRD
jgi:hypothetical protein